MIGDGTVGDSNVTVYINHIDTPRRAEPA